MLTVETQVDSFPYPQQRSANDVQLIVVVRQLHESDPVDRRARRCDSQPVWEPNPDEIREACAEIQSDWSVRERCRRRVYKPKLGWSVPVCRTGE
jgi:hypothetical protein